MHPLRQENILGEQLQINEDPQPLILKNGLFLGHHEEHYFTILTRTNAVYIIDSLDSDHFGIETHLRSILPSHCPVTYIPLNAQQAVGVNSCGSVALAAITHLQNHPENPLQILDERSTLIGNAREIFNAYLESPLNEASLENNIYPSLLSAVDLLFYSSRPSLLCEEEIPLLEEEPFSFGTLDHYELDVILPLSFLIFSLLSKLKVLS